MHSWLLTATKWAICAYLTVSLLNVQHFSFLVRVLSFVMMGLVSLSVEKRFFFVPSLLNSVFLGTRGNETHKIRINKIIWRKKQVMSNSMSIDLAQSKRHTTTEIFLASRWASDRILLLTLVVIAVLIAAALFECLACYTDKWLCFAIAEFIIGISVSSSKSVTKRNDFSFSLSFVYFIEIVIK